MHLIQNHTITGKFSLEPFTGWKRHFLVSTGTNFSSIACNYLCPFHVYIIQTVHRHLVMNWLTNTLFRNSHWWVSIYSRNSKCSQMWLHFALKKIEFQAISHIQVPPESSPNFFPCDSLSLHYFNIIFRVLLLPSLTQWQFSTPLNRLWIY